MSSLLSVPTSSRLCNEAYPPSVDGEHEELELESILQEVEGLAEQIDEDEKEAVHEFVETKSRSKFLYDGTNMVRIVPQKAAALKAAIGKAFLLHNKLKEKRLAVEEGRFVGKLEDFIPEGRLVPPLIRECTMDLELRENAELMIYTFPGCKGAVKRIKKKFLKGKVPDLSKYDSYAVAAAVLSFLMDLDEAIIPPSVWEEFLFIGQINNMEMRVDQLMEQINQLPRANYNTLGLLLHHFNMMSADPEAFMSRLNFARRLGHIIMGYSCPENVDAEYDLLTDTMMGLLSIPQERFIYTVIWGNTVKRIPLPY